MGLKRREFLKKAGLASLCGFGIQGSALNAGTDDDKKQRWGLVFDMRKCREEKDCTKCMSACHKIHNVPDIGNEKDEIKWIWKEKFEHAFPTQKHEFLSDAVQSAPNVVLCNHCDNPPCVRVCPTQATFKRETDGIVMMDFHRCIGCRFCMAACPYGARSFNWKEAKPFIEEINRKFPVRTKGVVEKCNLCAERIAKDQKPACVEACTAKAIIFVQILRQSSQ